MDLRQIFSFFLLLLWQADFLTGFLMARYPHWGMSVTEMEREQGLSGGLSATGEGRRENLKEYSTLQERLGSLCLWWWKHYWAFVFSLLVSLLKVFMTTVIWRETGKIPCYVICIWRWHMLMQTLVSHRAGCCYSWGWKLLLQFKKKKSSPKVLKLLENPLFWCDTSSLQSSLEDETLCLMGHLEYLHTSIHANI